MTLNISKNYSPGAGEQMNAVSYNIDISALFNAFGGLESQTSSLGGLTITPTSNSTSVFKVNDADGDAVFTVDTTNNYVKLAYPSAVGAEGAVYFSTSIVFANSVPTDTLFLSPGGTAVFSFTAALTSSTKAITFSNATVKMTALPTSPTGSIGRLYIDGTTLKVRII